MGTEDDRLVIHADEASIADGHAMRVPAAVAESKVAFQRTMLRNERQPGNSSLVITAAR